LKEGDWRREKFMAAFLEWGDVGRGKRLPGCPGAILPQANRESF